jgi:hypothetical protein
MDYIEKKVLTDLNLEEIEHLNQFLKDEPEKRSKNNYLIVKGPYKKINDINVKLDRVKYQMINNKKIKMIYNLSTYKNYDLTESPTIEFELEYRQLINYYTLYDFLNMIIYIFYMLRILIGI